MYIYTIKRELESLYKELSPILPHTELLPNCIKIEWKENNIPELYWQLQQLKFEYPSLRIGTPNTFTEIIKKLNLTSETELDYLYDLATLKLRTLTNTDIEMAKLFLYSLNV